MEVDHGPAQDPTLGHVMEAMCAQLDMDSTCPERIDLKAVNKLEYVGRITMPVTHDSYGIYFTL